jgi:signal transduction histidine kinase
MANVPTYHRQQMQRVVIDTERLGLKRLDLLLGLVGAVLAAVTFVILTDPQFSFALLDRSLYVALLSLTALGAVSLSSLALARYRESGRVAGLFQSSAFLVLSFAGILHLALLVFRFETQAGVALGAPGQLPVYVWSIVHIVSALLFAVGGVLALSPRRPRPPSVRQTLLVPIGVVGAITLLAFPLRGLLPALISEEGIDALIVDPQGTGVLEGVTALGRLLPAIALALLLVGVLAYRRSYLRDGPIADGYLAVALLLAAFGELHFMLYPAPYTALVTTQDLLRVAFFLVLLLGINAESRSDMRALRSAYAALDRLRQSEAERATLEERTRLARELHDGLAQDLWFAKLKHERLVAQVPEEVKPLALEVTQALDGAIAEAKYAMATMRADDRDEPLADLLAETVDDFGQRSGLRTEVSAADLPNALPPRTQAEVLRILQEALTNVRKHADATVVRVAAEVDDGRLLLRVSDNGRGFRAEETTGDGLGLQGMRERARLMGGELHVMSEPSGGTEVQLSVPLAESGAGGGR